MKLTINEVNVLKDKCSYGGDYAGLNKRLEYDKPKYLRLSLYDKGLLFYWLEDESYLGVDELSIKSKLFKSNGDYR